MENKPIKSQIECYVFRLHPGQDLYKEIEEYIKRNKIEAGFIMTCVGSLKEINIRLANAKEFLIKKENFEITSLVGCISCNNRIHLHISISDNKGNCFGGHLCDKGNIIYTTAEIIIGELKQVTFNSKKDEVSGWNELDISYKEK